MPYYWQFRSNSHRLCIMKILLANPRGFCAGVDRAVEIVERALETLGAPVYVRHEVVHNLFVVDGLRARGAIFTDEIADIPPKSTVISEGYRQFHQKISPHAHA